MSIDIQPTEFSLEDARSSARKGDAIALADLSFVHVNGDGVDTNIIVAFALLRLAATAGNDTAGENLINLSLRLTELQRAEADDLVRAFNENKTLPENSVNDGNPQPVNQQEIINALKAIINAAAALSDEDFNTFANCVKKLPDEAGILTVKDSPNDQFWSLFAKFGWAFPRYGTTGADGSGIALVNIKLNRHAEQPLKGICDDAAHLRTPVFQ